MRSMEIYLVGLFWLESFTHEELAWLIEPDVAGCCHNFLRLVALLLVERSGGGVVFEDVEIKAVVAPGASGAFTAIEETAGDPKTACRGDYGQIGDVGVLLSVALSGLPNLPCLPKPGIATPGIGGTNGQFDRGDRGTVLRG